MTERIALQLRLPQELKLRLEREAQLNGSSQNSEVIRALQLFRVHTVAHAWREAAVLSSLSPLASPLGGQE